MDARHIICQSRQAALKLTEALKEIVSSKGFDYVCAGVFFSLGVAYVLHYSSPFSGSVLATTRVLVASAMHFLIAYLFIVREEARSTPNLRESIAPVVSIAAPSLILNISIHFRPMFEFTNIGMCLMITGLLISVVAFSCLGKSFSILPARRRIVTRGLYRMIRHPAYAGEIMMEVGIVLIHLNIAAVTMFVVGITATLYRITIEERKLSADDQYRNYRLKVRYRLLPLVW